MFNHIQLSFDIIIPFPTVCQRWYIKIILGQYQTGKWQLNKVVKCGCYKSKRCVNKIFGKSITPRFAKFTSSDRTELLSQVINQALFLLSQGRDLYSWSCTCCSTYKQAQSSFLIGACAEQKMPMTVKLAPKYCTCLLDRILTADYGHYLSLNPCQQDTSIIWFCINAGSVSGTVSPKKHYYYFLQNVYSVWTQCWLRESDLPGG